MIWRGGLDGCAGRGGGSETSLMVASAVSRWALAAYGGWLAGIAARATVGRRHSIKAWMSRSPVAL